MEKEQAERPLQSPISLVHVLLPYCDPATVSFRRFLMYQALVIPPVFLSTPLSLSLSNRERTFQAKGRDYEQVTDGCAPVKLEKHDERGGEREEMAFGVDL